MSGNMYLLGIDVGTTAVKAAVFDERGRRVSKAVEEYALETPGPDLVELDAEVYWRSCVSAVRRALERAGKPDVSAVSVSSQGETLIAVGRDGKPLRKAIVWLDNRSKEEADELRSRFGEQEIYRITGQPAVVPTWPATKILWIRRREPHLFKKVWKFFLVEDYVLYKLTGRPATEPSVSSSTLMLDIGKCSWWGEMLGYLGVDEEALPEVLPSGAPVGLLSEEASRELGVREDVVVAAGAFDQAAAALGAGNVEEGAVSESTGAALAIVAPTRRMVFDPRRRIPLHRHAVPGLFFLMPWCQTAGMLLKWFRDGFARVERLVEEEAGVSAYKLLDAMAERVPPGSEGLVVLPHLAGAASPEFDPKARGVIFGLTLRHGMAHVVRALLESVGYMLRRNIELLEGLGLEVREVRSIGGGARSAVWCRIKADILQKPLLTPGEEESACLGAAILAGAASGVYRSVEEAAKAMSFIKEKVEPNPENKDVYERLYKLYVELYEALKPLFQKPP